MVDKKRELADKHALDYHSQGRPGKIEVVPTTPCFTALDLSLAYTPGVAAPCLAIEKNPDDAFKYTAKGNLVAVVSNGSAVLGLGNIGALAGKPVMEGKGVLFKRFADVDVFDIEINESTVEGMVRVTKALEPTFGGINLEDIKAPECFEVERQLVEIMDIPVFHDDQHGTAIISSAGLVNAMEIGKKDFSKVKVVVNGAGASAIACSNLYIEMGIKRENVIMCDSKGVIYKGRTAGMNKYKEEFAVETELRTLEEAMKGADIFLGCSVKGACTKQMVKDMAKNPIIFAMANPDPEITPEEVASVRDDVIMATGRSDYPNQVNNVLGFPFIFRGALDVKARKINLEMKKAAVYALANLAKAEVPLEVRQAYDNEEFTFGPNYIIPKPFDTRVLTHVSPAVAQAAMDTGVAREPIKDMSEYVLDLEQRLGQTAEFSRSLRAKAAAKVKKSGKKIKMIFTDSSNERVLQAVDVLTHEGHFDPILLGRPDEIEASMKKLGLMELKDKVTIIHPSKSEQFAEFSAELFECRQRDGMNKSDARDFMRRGDYYGSMMIKKGIADALIAGPSRSFKQYFKPLVNVGEMDRVMDVSAIQIIVFRNKILFFTDTACIPNPTKEQLADVAFSAAELYKKLIGKEPNIAFLSSSNFGSGNDPMAKNMHNAAIYTKEKYPKLKIEGEMQADVATNKNIMDNLFPFNDLTGAADILVFPELNSANIAYKLLNQLSDADVIGPILVPLEKSVNIVQRTATVTEIVNMSLLTAIL